MPLSELLKQLEALRGGIPTFLLTGVISPFSLSEVRKALHDEPNLPEIDIVIDSPGGSPADAYRMIRTFRAHYETVNVIVPLQAKSAATLFSFGATRLVMHEFGELGPIDAQYKKDTEDAPESWASALNVQSSLNQIEKRSREAVLEMFKAMRANQDVRIGRKQLAEMLLGYSSKFYAPLLEKIDATEIGVMSRYLDIGKMYANRILKEYTDIDTNKRDELLDFLVYDCPDHGFVVDYNILNPYLTNLIKTTDEPFGEEYDKIINDISMVFHSTDLDVIGFVKTLTAQPRANNGSISNDETPTPEPPAKEEDNNGKRPVGRPRKNNGEEKPKPAPSGTEEQRDTEQSDS